jgi:NAD(P)H-dependent FMN reductase
MGATAHHYLGVDWQLRAVLAWFGARVVAPSVYLESAHFREGALTDEPSRRALADLVNALLDMPLTGGSARRRSPPGAARTRG